MDREAERDQDTNAAQTVRIIPLCDKPARHGRPGGFPVTRARGLIQNLLRNT